MQHTLKYLHRTRSFRIYPYRRPLTHLHCSLYTIVPMPMKQPLRIWLYKPREPSKTHKSNQTKHKIICVFYGLYCITWVYLRRHRSLQRTNSAQETDGFFQIVPKIAGNITYYPECSSRTLTGIGFAHHCAYIWQKHSNTYNAKIFLHRPSTYQWLHTTFFWQNIIHESGVTWASRRLTLPVTRLFVQSYSGQDWKKRVSKSK